MNGQVAGHFEPPVGSMPGSIVEASTTPGAGNPTHTAALPMQPPHVSGA